MEVQVMEIEADCLHPLIEIKSKYGSRITFKASSEEGDSSSKRVEASGSSTTQSEEGLVGSIS